MKLCLWGVRGSRPVSDSKLLGFGGNSTSIEFLFDREPFHIFLDGGTGLAHRGSELGIKSDRDAFYFLVTHTHWDHIVGYPYFKPLYNMDNHFTFFSSAPERESFKNLFFGLFNQAYLPIPPNLVTAQINFSTVNAGETFLIGERVHVSTYQLNHQGITLGYRLDYGSDSVAVITDNAPVDGGNFMGENWLKQHKTDAAGFELAFNTGLIRFLENCHTVVFDTHFTEQNLKIDWGHSTPQRAMKFCIQAGVKRLVLFHHAPEESDKEVEAKLTSVQEAALQQGLEVVIAREGDVWTLR